MSNVVFYYFPSKTMSESNRMTLVYGGQNIDDHHVKREDYFECRPFTLFEDIQVHEIDGKRYAQSLAVARHLGRRYGLAGDNIEEDFEINQNIELLSDIVYKAVSLRYDVDEAVKAKKHAEYSEKVYPALLYKLSEVIKKNNGYIALGRLTWADFLFVVLLDYVKVTTKLSDIETKYPSFQQLIDNVCANPRVEAYRNKASKTSS